MGMCNSRGCGCNGCSTGGSCCQPRTTTGCNDGCLTKTKLVGYGYVRTTRFVRKPCIPVAPCIPPCIPPCIQPCGLPLGLPHGGFGLL
jgi:hypothetical protein